MVSPMRFLMIGFAASLVFGQTAAAHAFLDRAEPRVGSRVAAPPAQIRLRFTQGLEPTLCAVKVEGPAGFGGAEAAQPLSADPHVLVVALRKPVPPGRYVVRWRVVSTDGHITQGDFSFEVRP
jgi:copper resistance protein C